jgi:hypothetical protein
MTTLAMIFGMLPMAIGMGDGGESQAPMGRAVIGGVITSTLLTLVVVPVAYTYLDNLGKRRRAGSAAAKRSTRRWPAEGAELARNAKVAGSAISLAAYAGRRVTRRGRSSDADVASTLNRAIFFNSRRASLRAASHRHPRPAGRIFRLKLRGPFLPPSSSSLIPAAAFRTGN